MEEENGANFKINKIVTVMTENTKMIKRMVMVCLLGKVVTFTKVAIKKMKEMAMARCFGQTVLIIRVNGEREFNMVQAK